MNPPGDDGRPDAEAPRPTTTTATNGSIYPNAVGRGLQRHEPITVEDRADAAVLSAAAAAARGFHLSTRCLDCGHWLSSPASMRRHRGPKCAARAVAA